MNKLFRAYRYFDTHPGMPLAVGWAVTGGWWLCYTSARLHQTASASSLVADVWMLTALYVYVCSVAAAGYLGWSYDALIAALNDEDSWLHVVLGFQSWLVVYDNDGTPVDGIVRMTREQAHDFAHRTSSFGVRKTVGLFKRFEKTIRATYQ